MPTATMISGHQFTALNMEGRTDNNQYYARYYSACSKTSILILRVADKNVHQ
jgi:hypothetical protein